jgi:tetraacyldisaccharide 4'-kinase
MLFDGQYRELVSGRAKGPLVAGVRSALTLLEQPYGWFVRRRNLRFDCGAVQPFRVPAPVISVGNLTVGGTGKTPLVAWLAQWLTVRGHCVTIISRGYGASNGRPNDEALELTARLPGVPHFQNPDRVAAAQAALQANPEQVLILDDAFQHRRLARDLDIVLLDALEPFGFGRLLPRGLLREPLESLARAQIVALSRSDAVEEPRRREIEAQIRAIAPQAIWLELIHQPRSLIDARGQSLPLEELRGKPVAAFCGIGNPAGFRHTLNAYGLQVTGFLELADHCPYNARDLARVSAWLRTMSETEFVLCTRKDLVKIQREELADKQLLALEIELVIVRGQADLESLLSGLMSRATRISRAT